MVDLVLQENNKVNLRDLWKELGIKTEFRHYVKRTVIPYGFEEGYDYEVVETVSGKTIQKDYIITLDMAKELCMIAKTNKGKLVRKYFIEVEKQMTNVSAETVKKLRSVIFDRSTNIDIGGQNRPIKSKDIDVMINALIAENKILLEQQYITSRTYCISDITQKFKDIEPFEGQSILWQRGILEHRQNGMFPSEYYDKNNTIISVYDKNRDKYYPRYTLKGSRMVEDILLNEGYEFK